ncbi:hypothetical protein CLV30_11762 [Haloactinopolyspora alba]|uniref:C2H2-type domain-containing protein n=1 Tax=Haloactinopolyspora alba TaxID=648780 RepID=A0A2P8DRC4_9ACTN|nr:hypothetical protein [Haloactinopolyspora alba]PSK99759.1 hypothetical protein CLV30_11762 [Haloactinopolyspora alba]
MIPLDTTGHGDAGTYDCQHCRAVVPLPELLDHLAAHRDPSTDEAER